MHLTGRIKRLGDRFIIVRWIGLRTLGLTLICLAGTLAASFAPAIGEPVTANHLKVSQAWSRATPGGVKIGVGYLQIHNTGRVTDRLVGGETAIAQRIEIHETRLVGGIMRMRALPKGVTIGAGQTVTFKPGGLHLMLIGMARPLIKGQSFKATLKFEKAGPIEMTFHVAKMGARRPDGGHHHHK